MSEPLRILISGAGIAGPICAYWLRRSHPSADITIVERAPEIRKEGQTVDVVTEGRSVFDAMGITSKVMENTTREKGLDFVDEAGGVWGHFPQDNGGSFTREIEIVRGKLAGILYEECRDMVEWRFDDSISSIEQDHEGVDIEFNKGGKGRYDILIIADGLASRTRAMAFNQDVRDPIKSLNQYVAGFSLPLHKDDDEYAKWYNTTNRRVILHRPDGFGLMRTNLTYLDKSKTKTTREICSSKTSIQQQKEYFANLFKDAGWISERIIEGMMESKDFYTYEVGQVKMDKWSKGRIVLIGDAASCPSPISGAGTNVAITQAYTLAACLTKYRGNHEKAFKAYEDDLRGWVEGIQKLPPGTPDLACPESRWGVRILLGVTWIGGLVMRSGISRVFGRLFGGEEKTGHTLPPFEIFDSVVGR